jgi:hypothetical protein
MSIFFQYEKGKVFIETDSLLPEGSKSTAFYILIPNLTEFKEIIPSNKASTKKVI